MTSSFLCCPLCISHVEAAVAFRYRSWRGFVERAASPPCIRCGRVFTVGMMAGSVTSFEPGDEIVSVGMTAVEKCLWPPSLNPAVEQQNLARFDNRAGRVMRVF